MTEMFLVTFSALIIVMAIMAVGVIFKGKKLQGSCGGLGRVIGEDCMFCDKKDECDTHHADEGECESQCTPRIEIDGAHAVLKS